MKKILSICAVLLIISPIAFAKTSENEKKEMQIAPFLMNIYCQVGKYGEFFSGDITNKHLYVKYDPASSFAYSIANAKTAINGKTLKGLEYSGKTSNGDVFTFISKKTLQARNLNFTLQLNSHFFNCTASR